MLKNINYNTFVQAWLSTLIILVALIIVVGGLTRLTDSGLSITEWELFRGIFPPTNSETWVRYFESYKEIPQYLLINQNMTLSEFKFIFLWEYAHRLFARFIGIVFLLPFLFLIYMDCLKKKLIIDLSCIFILILSQGLIGWYMVKSGLTENVTVSHYRLAIHLFLAFSIFLSLIWILLNLLNKTKKSFFQFDFNHFHLKILMILLFIQIILGALVSGLDAGKIYQTWPLMNGSYLPDDISSKEFFNLSQPSFVQFSHRCVAYIILLFSIYIGFNIFKKKELFIYKTFIPMFIKIVANNSLAS